MDKQWLDAYQRGPSVFSSFINNYQPLANQVRKLQSQTKILNQQISHRFNKSQANQNYIFPRKQHTTEESNTSLLEVRKYDLKQQNPWVCSLSRCLWSSYENNTNPERSKSRKITELSKVKERMRQQLNKSKRKKRPVEVREIHLSSKEDKYNPQSLLYSHKRSTNKLFATTPRRGSPFDSQNKNTNNLGCSPKTSIKVINRPMTDTPSIRNVPTEVLLLKQRKLDCNCLQNCCICFQQSQQNGINPKYMTKRPQPDVRHLIIQKRQIKILTSREFNERRSKDKEAQLYRHHKNTDWRNTMQQTGRPLKLKQNSNQVI